MRLLIKNRAKGKTTQMIYTSEATGYPIVVETEAQKSLLMDKAKNMDVIIPEPVTINDVERRKLRGCRIEKVLIDEGYNIIANALKEYIGCEVAAVTLTDRIKEQAQFEQSLKSR